jgi:hypothetical protein
MWSLDVLEKLARDAGREARRSRKQPRKLTEEEIDSESFTIPFLGTHVPKGWEQTEQSWFCDSSGFGRDDEPALSLPRFKEELKVYFRENPDHGIAITQQGQFQVYVHAYRRIKPKTVADEFKQAMNG